MKIIKNVISILVVFAITFTIIPAMGSGVEVHAASKPAQVKSVNAKDNGTGTITITWKKVKGVTGYQICRSTNYSSYSSIAKVSTTSYKDTNFRSWSNIQYKVRAYKCTYKTQYYNSKTNKWQSKKPKKKYWKACPSGTYKGKKTRKVVKSTTYGKYSAAKYIFSNMNLADYKAIMSLRATFISAPNTTIEVGASNKLHVESNSTGAMTYSSSDSTIATVSSSGVVTGQKTGTVTITIKQARKDNYLEGKTTTQVTVVKAKDKKFMNCNLPSTMTHNLSEGKFTINVESTNGAKYESSNPLIATVSNGISANLPSGYTTVTLYKAGTVNITITSKFNSDQRHTIKLIVLDDLNVATVPNIEVSPIEIEVGESRNLTVNSNSTGTITYKSSNSNIATVSSSGVVTGQGAGTATITISQAATNDYLAGSTTTKVTVNEPVVPVVEYDDFAVVGTIPTVVNIGTSSLDYNVVLPTNNCTVTWKSSKPKSIDVTQTSAKSFMLTVYKPSASRRDVVAKNIIITGTLNNYPSDYKGPTELRYTIENTGYPIEGTTSTGNIYKVVRRYGNIYVGGYIDNNFTFTYMPSGSTFKINASEFAGYKF